MKRHMVILIALTVGWKALATKSQSQPDTDEAQGGV
jgi:hypothetical protein